MWYTKKDYIKRVNTQIEAFEALIYFTEKFMLFVREYDGKVYNRKLFDEFNVAGIAYSPKPGVTYKSTAYKEDVDVCRPVSITIQCREVETLDEDFKPKTIVDYLSGYTSEVRFGTVGSVRNRAGGTFVDAEGRYSYERYVKLAEEKIDSFRSSIKDHRMVIDHLDEYESLHDEIVGIVNSFCDSIPNRILALSKMRGNIDPLFKPEPTNEVF